VVDVCAYDEVIANYFLHPNIIIEDDGFEEWSLSIHDKYYLDRELSQARYIIPGAYDLGNATHLLHVVMKIGFLIRENFGRNEKFLW
jgi:hypothetical protein